MHEGQNLSVVHWYMILNSHFRLLSKYKLLSEVSQVWLSTTLIIWYRPSNCLSYKGVQILNIVHMHNSNHCYPKKITMLTAAPRTVHKSRKNSASDAWLDSECTFALLS